MIETTQKSKLIASKFVHDLIVSNQQIPTTPLKVSGVPGDKSISHRVLLVGAATPNSTKIYNLNQGSAVGLLIPALQTLGVQIDWDGSVTTVSPPTNNVWTSEPVRVNLGPSSAAARLLLGLLAGLGVPAIIDGNETLRSRPMNWVVNPLRELGIEIDYLETPGCLPVAIRGGSLQDGQVKLQVGSAQACSAILFAAFGARRKVNILHPVRSRDHTDRLLHYIGVGIEYIPEGIQISGVVPQALPEYYVPGDPSAAAFLAAAHVFQQRKTELILENICLNPTRIGFFEVLKECGIPVEYQDICEAFGEPIGAIAIGKVPDRLQPFQIDDPFRFHSMIDEIPLVAALATQIPGQSSIFGAQELVFKETNRLLSISSMLNAFGGQARVIGNALHITGGKALQAGVIPSFGDHRIAMTAVALASSLPGNSRILQGECYEVSFPEFLELMSTLGLNIHISERSEIMGGTDASNCC